MKKLLVKHAGRIIAQTEGADSYIQEWLEGDKFKYPEGYTVEYVDITAEEAAKKAREDQRNNFSFKGATIKELREEMNAWLELQK